MAKKNNILIRALSKLKLMEKQLIEESQVLDELKLKEEADENELETLRASVAARDRRVCGLEEELAALRSEKDALARELSVVGGAYRAQLEKERAEARGGRMKALEEVGRLEAEAGDLRRRSEELAAELERSRAAVNEARSLYEAAQLKLKEQEVFSRSASSALREKEEDITQLRAKAEFLSAELAKAGEDHCRRSELLRLELEEAKRFISHLNREVETRDAELARAKKELAGA